MTETPVPPPPSLVETTILELCAERGPDKSIDPNEAAKTIAIRKAGDKPTGPEDWHKWLGEVRRTAVTLAKAGRLVIYRKGKPVDPADFRGVYRLGLPRHD
jgi:hypothetical protein